MATEVRTASVVWNGDLINGSGMITYVSSGVFSRLPISWGARTGPHGGKTSPEELLAAAHASCFSMAFSSRLATFGRSWAARSPDSTVGYVSGSGPAIPSVA